MIRIHRLELTKRLQDRLDTAQADLARKPRRSAVEHWDARRRGTTLRQVLEVLQKMAGPYQRCMYCCDSHATDIEHFWPKTRYRDRCYRWDNLLLGCTECGRLKGESFPLDDAQQPLLLNPCEEDPWNHLDYDPSTGNLTARFDPADNQFSTKGETTVETLHLDRREALALVYQRTYRRLRGIVEAFLADPGPSARLVERLREMDDHGLLPWLLGDRGAQDEPFATLRRELPEIWSDLRRELIGKETVCP